MRSVSVVVTSFKTIPLKNVTVTALKSGESSITDSTGLFSLKCFRNDVLKVSAYGFVERKQKLKAEMVYKIDLVYTDNVQNFNKAVSHGHIGETVLRDAVFSRENKSTRDYSKYKSIFDAISSEIYNVRVNGNTIVNTKLKSFDRTPEVLLVVDDKIVSDISYISTEYVKSIEFVDDVSTAMYGAMGANGVLKIKLK
ncbi:MAG: hypothetical protein E4H43_00975 [Bacteroidia bacterium]|nr:MAG: hypothetical protein E4H43_00975 [Bacteroidia bacterium]